MSRVDDRLAAARTLGRVMRRGAWANVAVRSETRAGGDLRAVQSLVMGALRHIPWLDRRIVEVSGRGVDEMDRDILDLLRVGAHELADDERRVVPIVVDTIVTAAASIRPRAKGFVNAVMRRIAERDWPPPDANDLGYPLWLVESLARTLGDDVEAFLMASQSTPRVGVRSAHPVDRADPVVGIPHAWILREGESPRGEAIQDPASVAVGWVVAPRPADRVLDVAAAPGGKTAHLLEQVGTSAVVAATDRHARRVRDARRRVPGARWAVADGTRPPFADRTFDRVLLDAPCTGLGTLRRRPEIRYRVSPDEVSRLAALQRRMLEASLELVAPGGRLVYSVCTVTPEETIDVVSGLGGAPSPDVPGVVTGDGTLLGPHLGETDAMFVCVFDR